MKLKVGGSEQVTLMMDIPDNCWVEINGKRVGGVPTGNSTTPSATTIGPGVGTAVGTTDAAGNEHAAATQTLPAGSSEIAMAMAEAPQTNGLGRYNGRSGARISILTAPSDLAYRYPAYLDLTKAVVDYPYNVSVVLPDKAARVLKSHVDKPQPIDWFLWTADGQMVRCDRMGRITDGLEFMVPAAEGAVATGSVFTQPNGPHTEIVQPWTETADNKREPDGLMTYYGDIAGLVNDAVATHHEAALMVDTVGVFPGFGPPDVWMVKGDKVVRA